MLANVQARATDAMLGLGQIKARFEIALESKREMRHATAATTACRVSALKLRF